MAEFSEAQIKAIAEAAELYKRQGTIFPIISEDMELVATAGSNDLDFDPIKADRLAVITVVSGRDDTSAPTRIRLGYYDGVTFKTVKCGIAPALTESVDWSGLLILRQGWYIRVRIEGATAGDDLYALINGYYIKL